MAELINWSHDFDGALRSGERLRKPILLDFSAAPMWAGCARLDAEVYPDPDVARLVSEDFVPVRVHAKEHKEEFGRLGERFDAQWTPTTLVIDPSGTERHRIEGFLPAHDFRSQLELGLAKAAFGRGAFEEAALRFEDLLEKYPDTDAAPEAQYWAGVSRYKASGDAAALTDTAKRFGGRYADSSWAKKASVWAR